MKRARQSRATCELTARMIYQLGIQKRVSVRVRTDDGCAPVWGPMVSPARAVASDRHQEGLPHGALGGPVASVVTITAPPLSKEPDRWSIVT
jgi:hypothetical protein